MLANPPEGEEMTFLFWLGTAVVGILLKIKEGDCKK